MTFEQFVKTYERINPEVYGIRLSLMIWLIVGFTSSLIVILNLKSKRILLPTIAAIIGTLVTVGFLYYDSYSVEKKEELVEQYTDSLELRKSEIVNVFKKTRDREDHLFGVREESTLLFISYNDDDGVPINSSVLKSKIKVFYDLDKGSTPYVKYSELDIDSEQFRKLRKYDGFYVKEIHLVKGYEIEELKGNYRGN